MPAATEADSRMIHVNVRPSQIEVMDEFRWTQRIDSLSALIREALAEYFSKRGIDFPVFEETSK